MSSTLSLLCVATLTAMSTPTTCAPHVTTASDPMRQERSARPRSEIGATTLRDTTSLTVDLAHKVLGVLSQGGTSNHSLFKVSVSLNDETKCAITIAGGFLRVDDSTLAQASPGKRVADNFKDVASARATLRSVFRNEIETSPKASNLVRTAGMTPDEFADATGRLLVAYVAATAIVGPVSPATPIPSYGRIAVALSKIPALAGLTPDDVQFAAQHQKELAGLGVELSISMSNPSTDTEPLQRIQ